MLLSLRIAFTAVLFAPALLAQDLIFVNVDGVLQGSSGAVATIPDVDGDGSPDLIAGDPLQGEVRVVSSANGLITSMGGPVGFGAAVSSVADLDGDGHADVAVGHPAANVVTVHSSISGAWLATYVGELAGDEFGASLSNLGDLDGDGVDELAIGAPGAHDDAGSVTVVGGATGAQLYTADGAAPGDRFGSSLSAEGTSTIAGDNEPGLIIGAVAGDNEPGLMIGALALDNEPGLIIGALAADNEPGLIIGASPHAAPAYVEWHGFGSGSTTLRIEGTASSDGFGAAAAVVGDVDGDGRTDLAIGAPGSGSVSVHSGLDGALIYELEVGGAFGSSIVFVGDVSGDGVGDFAVSDPSVTSPAGSVGRVSVHSGTDGAVLAIFEGSGPEGAVALSTHR